MKLTNKIALITGGSRGLGRDTALALARNGSDVVLTYREQKSDGEQVVAEIEKLGRKAALLQLDIGQTSSFETFRNALTRTLEKTWNRSTFDFLINNAGNRVNATFAEFTEDEFDQLCNVHFKGTFFLTQKLLPVIADGGAIVNTSSGLARFSYPGYSAYGAMKGAIEVLTRYLAKEVGTRGIRANVVAPGPILTDFNRESLSHPGATEALASQTALGRIGAPDDIGGVVAFLCSDEAKWVNAQRIEVSGGIFI